jgi:hypothetical protein
MLTQLPFSTIKSYYQCETWTLTAREEHTFREPDSKVVRGICGFKRDEVTQKWRKVHYEDLHEMLFG